MYLLYCAAAFALMAVPKRHRFEWAVLAVLMVLLWCNKEIFDKNGVAVYAIRASLVLAGSMFLLVPKSLIGFYQSIILLCVLIVYGALAYDVAIGRDFLIYNNFETVIYGLVACQFLGVFPTIWDCYRDHYSSGRARGKHISRIKRT
jgi:CDP-diglyceride synthetase